LHPQELAAIALRQVASARRETQVVAGGRMKDFESSSGFRGNVTRMKAMISIAIPIAVSQTREDNINIEARTTTVPATSKPSPVQVYVFLSVRTLSLFPCILRTLHNLGRKYE